MPIQYHVYGPSTVTLGSSSLGQTDGRVLIGEETIEPCEPITTDAFGGGPEDWIQQYSRMRVILLFQKWDEAVLNTARQRLRTNATPVVAGIGVAGDVGLLVRADRPSVNSLTIEGTKATARNGGVKRVYHDVIRDPEENIRLEEIGWRAARRAIVLLASANEQGVIMTPTNVAGN